MRPVLFASLAIAISGAPLANASELPDDQLARSVAELSEKGCYGIASGSVPLPSAQDPDELSKSMNVIDGMGLSFGVSDSIFRGLGQPGLTLVSQATMGSKSFENGDIVLSFGGRQPGCRVILLTEPNVSVTEAISAHLLRSGWKAAPPLQQRAGTERRAFVRRDDRGAPYLMNLITITTPAPDSKLRMLTTTVRIPAGVKLPQGY